MSTTLDVIRLVEDLRPLVGAPAATRLAPRFAQTAAIYQESERETRIQAEGRRKVAKAHIALLDMTEKDIAHLLRRLDAMSLLIPEASTRGHLPGTASSGTLGQLEAQTAARKTLDASGEALRIVMEQVRAWRETARLDMRGKPGRKVGDRRLLAEWVILRLAREGIPVTTNPDGIAAKVLQIVYHAAGIKQPVDLYRDLCYAIEATARERQNLH